MAREKIWTLENTVVFFQLARERRNQFPDRKLIHDTEWMQSMCVLFGCTKGGAEFKLNHVEVRSLRPDYPNRGVFEEVYRDRAAALFANYITEEKYFDLIRGDQ